MPFGTGGLPYFAYSTTLVSRSTWTLICPGYSSSSSIRLASSRARITIWSSLISEDQMVILARELAKRIEDELEYPGQIKVHVLRETKVVEYAK